jgi:hypothetical protein
MRDYEVEYTLGLPILERLKLPVSESNCRRAIKAVDIAANRIADSDIFIYSEGAVAEVQSDSRDLKWSVTVDWEFDVCSCECECEDKTRHEEMAEKFGDMAGLHHCKHAIAVLLRCENDLNARLKPKSHPVVVQFPNSGREVRFEL